MNNHTILLVDDDLDLLHALQRRCEGIGLQVQTARNLLTATSLVEKGAPDLFCVDVNMPTGNGLKFCEYLASNPHTANIPVIVLTGNRDAETIRTCGRLRAHHLHKAPQMWETMEPLIRGLIAGAPRENPAEFENGRGPNATSWTLPEPDFEAGRAAEQADSGKTVVIADDDPDIVHILTQRFRHLGCQVVGARGTTEAWNTIRQTVPDLVCLDVNMPTGNGLSVCQMMREDDRLADIPVVILTGCAGEETVRRCHDMLAYYVEKSVNVWARVEPLARELLAIKSAPAAP